MDVPFSVTQVSRDFRALFGIAKLIGCDKNAAAISANPAVAKMTGTNVLELLGKVHLEAEQQSLVFNVSDLMPGVSGVKMNKLLQAAGMQNNVEGHWEPTDAGLKFCRIFDTGKRHHNGTPVQQIKWEKDVIQMLQLDEAA